MGTTITTANVTTTLFNSPAIDSLSSAIGLMLFYVLVSICAIMSNITILVSIARHLVPQNTVNKFFASLAVSDLLMVVLSFLDCCAYLNGGWVFGEVTCKIQSHLLEISFSASTLTLVAVFCERYLLICCPHAVDRRRSHHCHSIRNVNYLIASVWILSFLVTSPLLHGYIVRAGIDYEDHTKELVCGNTGWLEEYRLVYYGTYSIVVYIVPLLLSHTGK